MPDLTPVDYDPPFQPSLVPVDHDPFNVSAAPKAGAAVQPVNIPQGMANMRGGVMNAIGGVTGLNDAARALRGEMTPEEAQTFALGSLPMLLGGQKLRRQERSRAKPRQPSQGASKPFTARHTTLTSSIYRRSARARARRVTGMDCILRRIPRRLKRTRKNSLTRSTAQQVASLSIAGMLLSN